MASIQRALDLVRYLTGPHQDASRIHAISEEFQQIQLSPDGWAAADAMLKDDESSVRFYGALTFQIKLNKEGPQVTPDTAELILSRIIAFLVNFTRSAGEKKFVLDKLCSSLSTYFIQAPAEWNKAVSHLVSSLANDAFIPQSQLEAFPDVSQTFPQLSTERQLVALRFCQMLAEDMYTCANSTQQQAHLHNNFKKNTADIATIMAICFNYPEHAHTAVSVEALNSFTAWVTYGHSTWSSDPVSLELLQVLTPLTTKYLYSNVDDLRDPAIDLFVSIMDFRPKFLKKDDLETISGLVRKKLGPLCAEACRNGEQSPEIITLSKLVASYGRTAIKDIVAHREHEASEEIVGLFLGLLTGSGYPGDEDELILSATEFWSEYAEFVDDLILESEPDTLSTWLPIITNDMMKAVQSYIPKLTSPPREIRASWDEETENVWKFFRDNVSDFLDSVNNIPETNLFQQLIAFAMQILPNKQWTELEAIIFCINAISEGVRSDNVTQVAAISTLLGSSLFGDISDISSDVPVLLRRAVLTTIDSFSSIIKANPIYIPPVLTFLFTILESAPKSQEKTADRAAKSFEALCSSCRQVLTPHLAELLQQCPRALSGPSHNAYQREKVMAALSSIIEALPVEEDKVVALQPLIEVIEGDLNTALVCLQKGDIENGEILGTCALQCLASIAKGIQAPDDGIIDLNSDDECDSSKTNHRSAQQFWTQGGGAVLQERILACFNIIPYMYPKGGDAIDAACTILRAGLKETQPGPFVFKPIETVKFIVKGAENCPRIETLVSIACSFVSAYSRKKSPDSREEILHVYEAVARVTHQLQTPSNDPQLAQLCVDFFHRLLSFYLDLFFAIPEEAIYQILGFTIGCLTGQAPMLKRCACNFFETLIGQTRPNNPIPPPPTQTPIPQIMNRLLPLLTTSLVSQVSGQAQRSELDALCKPLRALVFGVPASKRYLEEALASVDVGEGLVDVGDKEKRVFLAKVMSLRGGKQTTGVVKEFWARCKGTVSSFE